MEVTRNRLSLSRSGLWSIVLNLESNDQLNLRPFLMSLVIGLAVFLSFSTVAQESSVDAATPDSATEVAEVPEPKMVSVAFRNANLQQIIQFYNRELGKPVIPDDAIQNVKITIVSDKKLPLPEAFELISNALRKKGVIIREGPKHIEFLPISEIKRISRRVVGPDESVTDLEDMSEIVDKVFIVEHYNIDKLKEVVLQVIPEYAFVLADPNVNRLIVTSSAGDLERIEAIVARMDVPQANQTIERIFTVKHGDAAEIVSMIRVVLVGSLGSDAEDLLSGMTGNTGNNNRFRSRNQPAQPPANNIVFVEREDAPILLRADLARNWIVAVAPPTIMDQIEKWIAEFDKPKETTEPFELIDIQHADIAEVAQQLTQAISSMPDADIRNSVRIVQFVKSRQLLVFGSARGRNIVKDLLKQLDLETSQFQMIEEITLQYDSAENVKMKIEDLFGKAESTVQQWWGGFNQRNNNLDVKVTADAQRNTITVMTDPARMKRIKAIIAEQWDQPINVEDVKPKVYTLDFADPVQVKDLLEDMFTVTRTTTGPWWESRTETSTPVGRLAGQFSFQALRDSNKLVVSTKNQGNYVVIDELIAEIDKPQDAGLPMVIELKHANAEDIAEQLNAMFSEPGTPAQITRTERGLTDRIRQMSSAYDARGNNNNQNNNNNNRGEGQNDPSQMQFWWSQSRPALDELPTSNLIGRPRFVPVNRRNALMVMAPRAHEQPIRELIHDLDLPGSQVVIHAIITEVQHDDESTLGLRLASDPSILSDSRLGDQSIGGGLDINFDDVFGNDGTLNVGINLNFLIQLLQRKINLKILNEPRVYTSDNQEAHFFDGQDVPVITGDQSSRDTDSTFNRSFEYRDVGTRLHVRPHITQDGEVDLEVNLELSRLVNGSSVFGNFIFNRRETTTHVTLRDGQTVMISGILSKEDFDDVRKLPLLGDLPLVGGFFRSTERGVRNREVIAFITPYVLQINSEKERQASEQNAEWIQRVRESMTSDPVFDEESDLQGGLNRSRMESEAEPAVAE